MYSNTKQVYLNSDRTMCIELKIELQTESDKHFSGHLIFLKNSIWEEFITLPKLFEYIK